MMSGVRVPSGRVVDNRLGRVARGRLRVCYGLAARGYEGLLAYRAGSPWQVVAAAACGIADGGLSWVLARSDRLGLSARLALTSADAAAWSLAIPRLL